MNQAIQINPARKLTKRKTLECTCEFTNFRSSGKNLRYSTCDICSEQTVNNFSIDQNYNTANTTNTNTTTNTTTHNTTNTTKKYISIPG